MTVTVLWFAAGHLELCRILGDVCRILEDIFRILQATFQILGDVHDVY